MDNEIHASLSGSTIAKLYKKLSSEIASTVYGHEDTTKLLVGAFLIGGHVLLEGPPGIAKTLMAKSFAKSIGLDFNRIQFTPDLMPGDVTGVYVFDQNSASFHLSEGPIFADILLADEINRTPPKTQSALLEAMEERHVTIDGKVHSLGRFFFVMATQNPVDHEGTYPLPEAQLDRFLFKINMTYPSKELEQQMIARFSSEVPSSMKVEASDDVTPSHEKVPVVSSEELDSARAELRNINMDSSITDYIHRVVSSTRSHPDLVLGASPRAALNLALAAKYQAALEERMYVVPDDVKSIAGNVLSHRLIFQPEVYETEDASTKLVQEIVENTPIPSATGHE